MNSVAGGFRERIVGRGLLMPVLGGRRVPYVNLDNAATTPPFRSVVDEVAQFLPYYASVHRGSGYKSRVSTAAYDEAHRTVARFVGADPDTAAVVFGKNTTEAVNKLSYRYPLPKDAVVLTTLMEHHSNDLPWRARATVVRAGVTPEGRLDEDDFDRLLHLYRDRVALVTVSGASNVTGFVQPVHRLARKAHAVGACILVDAAQLAPHRAIDVKHREHPEHLDFVALSAHKLYAPFGTGALVGHRDIFEQGAPEYRGGGTVRTVTADDVSWADVPDREEAGSPNVIGAVALAAALQALQGSMDAIAAHERALTSYALRRLRCLPGVTVYGETDPDRVDDRVGVIPFNVDGVPHGLVAAVLGFEEGIGVRNGCFCAQPYVAQLLGMGAAARTGDGGERAGMVRLSFGAYNTAEDVDALVEALARICRGDYRGHYDRDDDGSYLPASAVPEAAFATEPRPVM
jgi:cysteine desulfurase/selenocysteine lyase